jgi:hypothetical protein
MTTGIASEFYVSTSYAKVKTSSRVWTGCKPTDEANIYTYTFPDLVPASKIH